MLDGKAKTNLLQTGIFNMPCEWHYLIKAYFSNIKLYFLTVEIYI